MNECSTGWGAALVLGLATAALGGEPPREEPALTLREAIARAAVHSPEVEAASAGETEAEASRVASSTTRPELRASTSPGYATGVPAPVLGGLPAIARVDLHATLFDPARLAVEEQARAELARAGGTLAATRVEAARFAAELFSRCLLDASLVEAAGAKTAALERARARSEALEQLGRATRLDVGRARLAEAEARQAEAEARTARKLDEAALRTRLGWPPGMPLRLDAASVAVLAADPPGADALAMARAADPELRALTKVAARLATAARWKGRSYLPVIQAGAEYARLYKTADWDLYYPAFQPDSWSVAAQISVPLWTGGRAAAETAELRARLAQVEAQRRGRERDLDEALASAGAAVERGRAGRELAGQREELAEESLRVTQALLAEGRVDPVDVAAAEAQLAEARRATASAEHAWRLARLARLVLLGAIPGLEDGPPDETRARPSQPPL
jgi:outer membrane protein